ncbi:MAG: enoyl-CoA hydratase/isomerase family protein [Porticoccaceae bacterium]|nr:enoyl-CoA hydratase/isomerase family protein [Porticoccaceae bacterium]
MSDTHMSLEVADGVGLITLNRPDEGNPVVQGMVEELLDKAIICDEDPAIRAVVLTGKGPMFCVGGGLKDFAEQGDNITRHLKLVTQLFHGAISKFNRMAPPVIAAINGTAAGGGLSLALTTDLAISAASAKFTMAYTNAGLAPDGSSSFYLAKMVGMRRAKEMALLNTVLSAEQALDWGLINRVVPDDQLMSSAMEMARKLAQGSMTAYGETKKLMLAGATESLESQMELEGRAISSLAGSPDGREGVGAFIDKRKPEFKN